MEEGEGSQVLLGYQIGNHPLSPSKVHAGTFSQFKHATPQSAVHCNDHKLQWIGRTTGGSTMLAYTMLQTVCAVCEETSPKGQQPMQ